LAAGKKLGSLDNPLLVSVRSGAPVSMPGMMDTILNLGLNDETVEALARVSGDARFAYDSYRRFIQMFSGVVLEVSAGKDEEDPFEEKLSALRKSLGVEFDHQIPADSLKKLIADYKEIVKKTGKEFPSEPEKQLRLAIEAVFRSWNTPRANTYRELNNISADLGTAVNIVTMAFGNLGSDCGTGVCFTRDGSTGENKLYGEYLMNAQGEDVVAGIRTPSPIAELENVMPDVYKEFFRIAKLLENHYKDMQDIEFTVERGKLYILQTRDGKRTAAAAVKIAMDLYREGLIDARTAVSRVTPDQVEQLLHPQIDPKAKYQALAKGLPASPGAAVGAVVFDADEAAERGKTEPVILVRPETTPDDIHGLFAAKGVLTSHGGMTSHAAVVARGMGRPCVSGAESVKIDLKAGKFTVGDVTIKKGDFISLDGTKGVVIVGRVPLIEPTFSDDFKALLDLANKESKLQVWANADTPEDAKRAFEFGAKGVGLCRTEHMFMAADRLPSMQKMVIASAKEARVAALAGLEPMQKSDFVGIFEAMGGYPVIIRLLDPPLHEFLPKIPDLKKELAEVGADSERGKEIKVEIARAAELHEFNPMLGFRGCRLGIVYPEIFEMQIRAIISAACEVSRKGLPVKPEIMMPLVGIKEEMRRLEKMAREIAAEVMKSEGVKVDYKVGTMIEVPRAAMVADEVAEYAEFFSFGTNDLTQTTYGYSRDDAENKFLGFYVEDKVVENNPFHVLDRDGVGGLMKIAKEKGSGVRPDLSVGICGEHGGNPSSVAFCHQIGLDYVSCSPFRVPVARLAAAHAALGKLN
jgi:pyruvate,orthophosphate dikinase